MIYGTSSDGQLTTVTQMNTPSGSCPGTSQFKFNMSYVFNSERADVTPHFSRDGRTLVFASARPGGLGGQDIWVTRRRRRDN